MAEQQQRRRKPAQGERPRRQQRSTGERQGQPRQGQRRQPARHVAPAHAAKRPPARRRSPVLPIIVAILCLVFVGLLVFFFMRGCGGQGSANGQDNNQAGANTTDTNNGSAQQAAKKDGTDINLLMVGDILFHYQVRMSGLSDDGSRNYDHIFAHVLDELKDKDIKVLNQETPLGGAEFGGTAPDGYSGYPEFNGPQEMADAEVKAGFNVVLKATNHAMDNASSHPEDPYALVRSEQNYWAKNYPNIAVIGEANPDDSSTSVKDVYVYEKDGFKVALLNYTLDLNGNETFDSQGMVSMLEEEHVKETVAKAHEMADMVVVFPHWGEEYSTEPVEMQREWAQMFAELGVDVIIGNHPHVIEPVTLVEGTDGKKVPCYWSTGNFTSTSPSNESLVGGIAELTLHKASDGTCSVTSAQFKPVISHLGMSTDMTTYLISDWTDELASTNYLNTEMNPDTDNTSLTPTWANEFCAGVLGSGYDEKTGTFTLDLDGKAESFGSSSGSSSSDSSVSGSSNSGSSSSDAAMDSAA